MATEFKACSIDGCKGNAHGSAQGRRGWCSNHYLRWWSHGDPLAGRVSPGEPERYFQEVVLTYEGDECLPWPYGQNGSGYGIIWRDGEPFYVHRLSCEAIDGPPPTPDHEAAHSCGKGHLRCCTKRHLSWKTNVENGADKITHGTHVQGERHGRSKLTEMQVRQIREALRSTLTQRQIAKSFGVSEGIISLIKHGKNWGYLV